MKKRLYALLLVGVLTFNQAGMIVFAEESGETQQAVSLLTEGITVTPSSVTLGAGGGTVKLTASSDNFPDEYSVQNEQGKTLKENTDYMGQISRKNLLLYFDPNTDAGTKIFYVVINDERVATITQAGQSDVVALINSIEKLSQTTLSDGRTQVVYKVSGSNLKEVGIKVKEGPSSTIPTSQYTVERSGEGAEQTVTLTFQTVDFVSNYTINFYASIDSQTVEKSETIKLSPADQTAQASISDVSVDKEETEWNEGTVNVSVKGTELSSDLEVKVLDSANQEVKANVGKISGTATEQKFTVGLPDNTTQTDKTYTISVNVKGQTESKQASVKVKGKDYRVEQKITDIVASRTEVSNDNRTVEFTLTGENLSTNTAFKIIKNQIKEDLTQYNIHIEGKGTTQKVTMTFPENMSNEDIVYKVNIYADGNTSGTGAAKGSAEIKVLKAQTSEAAVAGITVNNSALTSKGGMATFDVAGSGLDGNVAVKVLKNGIEDTSLNPMFVISTVLAQQFTINFPENTTDKDVVYTVKAASSADAEASLWKEATVTVAAKAEVKEGKVTAITVSPETVEQAGGKVQLKVTGTDLTADNWSVEVKTFVEGTDFDRTSQYPATVSEITADGATITIPENGMTNTLEYRVVAGALKNGVIQEQATATIKQNGGQKKTDLVFTNAYLADEKTVVAEFENQITLAGTEDELKAKITLSGYQSAEGGMPGALGAGDSVKVEGNTLTISLNTEYNATAASQISIAAGALVVNGETTNRAATHTLSTKPTVKQIDYVKDVFDYKGGNAIAKLTGVRVNELTEGSVEATIIDPGTLEKKEIPTTVKYGTEPTIEFTLPENTTDTTQSYLLSLKVNGQNVYEVDGTNIARRAIVSVLPKGVDEDAQTISSITITGNNKLDIGNTNQITVTVEQQVGSLKTVLRLAGTNLDSTKTEVRAIDENGIVWPVYHIPECDGSWRFVAIDGVNKNGVIGDGNSQFVELLPPRYAGTNKTYRIQIALDGEHFLEEPVVTLTVKNESVKGQEEEWVECGEADIKNIIVKYVDQKTGEEIAKSDLYSGYEISMYEQFDIGPKDIEGYKLVNGPDMTQYTGFYRDNPKDEFVFEYVAESTEEPEKPTPGEEPKPGEDPKPSNPASSDDKKTDTDQKDQAKKDDTKKNNTVKTGDTAPIFPYAVAMAASVAGAATLIFKKKEEK